MENYKLDLLNCRKRAWGKASLYLVCGVAFLVSSSFSGIYAQGSPKGHSANSGKAPKEKLKKMSQIKVPGLKFSDKIPSNFPVPEYPRNVLKTSFIHSTKGHPSATANIITKDSAQVVFRWYQAVCKRGGWKVRLPEAQTVATGKNSKMYMLDAVKGRNSLSISCYKCMDPSFKGTSVNLCWSFLGR